MPRIKTKTTKTKYKHKKQRARGYSVQDLMLLATLEASVKIGMGVCNGHCAIKIRVDYIMNFFVEEAGR